MVESAKQRYTRWDNQRREYYNTSTALRSHLVIGDPHADPLFSNRRATWLGRLAAHLQPSVIIIMGDLGDYGSLCKYDIGTIYAEHRRIDHDIAAVQQWLTLFGKPITEYNKDRKTKLYKPEMVLTLGNHDNRLDLIGKHDPKQHHIYCTENLGLQRWGWEVVPFLESKTIDRITYKHYETAGNTARPMSGIHHAHNMLNNTHSSITVGHSHNLEFKRHVIKRSGRVLCGLVAGCALDPDQSPLYAGEDPRKWWRGAIMCRNVEDGHYDPEFISMDQIKTIYGQAEDDIPAIVTLPENPTPLEIEITTKV